MLGTPEEAARRIILGRSLRTDAAQVAAALLLGKEEAGTLHAGSGYGGGDSSPGGKRERTLDG
jgi:hypothetical protein